MTRPFFLFSIFFFLFGFTLPAAEQSSPFYIEQAYAAEQKKASGELLVGALNFPSAVTDLGNEGLRQVAPLAALISSLQFDSAKKLKILGYGDKGEKNVRQNLTLGLARAGYVARSLEKFGLPMEHAVLAAYGDPARADKNCSRVEIWLVSGQKNATSAVFYIFLGVVFFLVSALAGTLIYLASKNKKV